MEDRLKNLITELLFGRKVQVDGEEGLYTYANTANAHSIEDDWRDFDKYGKDSFIAGICFSIMLLHILLMSVLYLYSVFSLTPRLLPSNPFYIILWTAGPAAVWTWSTSLKFWQFYNRKMFTLYESFAAVMVMVLMQLLRFLFRPVLSLCFLIPVTGEVTENMLVGLARGTLLLTSAVPTLFLSVMFGKHFLDKYTKQEIEHFVVTRDMDLRKNKQFKYDLKVIKEMDTGEVFTITEDSRFLHTFADGTTGTAKTSSVLTVAVADDLDQKAFNTDYQKKETVKRLNSGEFEIAEPFDDSTFSIEKIRPRFTPDPREMAKRQEAYDFLRFEVPSAGITVVAPNASWSDEVYSLAVSRGFKVNRIDPMPDAHGNPKEGFKGFNPLFVSPRLRGEEREVDITNKANIFADVLAGIFERGGGGDVYFKNLNSTWTIATCMLVMLAYDPDEDPRRNVNQPNPSDIQKILNNPDLARTYLERFAYRFGRTQSLYDENGVHLGDFGGYSFAGHDEEFKHYSDMILTNGGAQALQGINCGIYQYVWDTFFRDILGARREDLYDQANGLRMQVNKLLGHRYIRSVFCVPDSLAVDLDEILSEGQITCVNYALELGKSVSMAFGQSWILCYGKAVTRRPGNEKTRLLHFNYIDEFSSIVHPDIDEFFTLHRQYRCANLVALQTLDQMSKSRDTEYMRGILLGNCATQIVYGRLSTTEMEIYEKMAGKAPGSLEQDTVSETALSSENPSYSWSRRTTMQQENRMEGSQLRYRDFQTVTVFTVKKNTPVPPFVGKVDFLPGARRKGKPRVKVYWDRFIPEPAVREKKETVLHKYGIGNFDENDGVLVRSGEINDKAPAVTRPSRRRFSAGGAGRQERARPVIAECRDESSRIYVSVKEMQEDVPAREASSKVVPQPPEDAPQAAGNAPRTDFPDSVGKISAGTSGPPEKASRAPDSGRAAGSPQEAPEPLGDLFNMEYRPPARQPEAPVRPLPPGTAVKKTAAIPAAVKEEAEEGSREEKTEAKADAKAEAKTEEKTTVVQLPLYSNGFLGGTTNRKGGY